MNSEFKFCISEKEADYYAELTTEFVKSLNKTIELAKHLNYVHEQLTHIKHGKVNEIFKLGKLADELEEKLAIFQSTAAKLNGALQ